MERSIHAFAALAVVMCGAATAHADTVTCTETTTASGSLDGIGFTNALVTLVLTGDTTNLTNLGGGVFSLPGTGTVSVAGDGSDTFTDQVSAVANQGLPGAGISDFTSGFAILFTLNSGFSAYDLTTSIGPLSGAGEVNRRATFPTAKGTFGMTSIGTVTFTAVESTSTAVPEPGSLLLVGTGLAGLLVMGMRKKTTVWKAS